MGIILTDLSLGTVLNAKKNAGAKGLNRYIKCTFLIKVSSSPAGMNREKENVRGSLSVAFYTPNSPH